MMHRSIALRWLMIARRASQTSCCSLAKLALQRELPHRKRRCAYVPTGYNAFGVPPSDGAKNGPEKGHFGGPPGGVPGAENPEISARRGGIFAPGRGGPGGEILQKFGGVSPNRHVKTEKSVPTGGVIKYPKKCAPRGPPGAPRGPPGPPFWGVPGGSPGGSPQGVPEGTPNARAGRPDKYGDTGSRYSHCSLKLLLHRASRCINAVCNVVARACMRMYARAYVHAYAMIIVCVASLHHRACIACDDAIIMAISSYMCTCLRIG